MSQKRYLSCPPPGYGPGIGGLPAIPEGYEAFLGDLKERIQAARVRASFAVNAELLRLYWEIGREILARQESEGWGTKVIDRLARDLRAAFPEMTGLSRSNLKYMRAFAAAWSERAIGQRAVGQIPWGHNITLLEKSDDERTRLWYAEKALEHGWSRDVLVAQIESRLHERQGKAITTFSRALPAPDSDLAQQALKDPYNFEFLALAEEAKERELQCGLLEQVRKFLMEMGEGFAFVASQYHLEVEGRDFYIDLLLYHLGLHRYVVVELKVRDFEPEYAGKMSFYLAAVDDLVRRPEDGATIGLILCKGKSGTVAEYALRDSHAPIGVAEYRTALPKPIQGELPAAEAIATKLRELPDEEDKGNATLASRC